jgi:AmmeMemoRadiSam system protein A
MTSDVPRDEALGPDVQQALLGFARASIVSVLTGAKKPRRPEGPGLESRRGAFVTLRRSSDEALRGCIGFVRADRPLVDVVADVAVAAALRDDRFAPVTAEELASLAVEISVLGPTFRVAFDEVVVGEMGLLVRACGRQGLLLPQVPLEHGWDRDTFLDRTCLKAGLGAAVWREPTTEIYAFRCVVFGEKP